MGNPAVSRAIGEIRTENPDRQLEAALQEWEELKPGGARAQQYQQGPEGQAGLLAERTRVGSRTAYILQNLMDNSDPAYELVSQSESGIEHAA